MIPANNENIRIDVLRRLAEQAMTDLAFREVAREDLDAALAQFGYALNEDEMALVHKFRAVLAEAGVDLSLTGDLDDLVVMAGIDPNLLR